MDPNALADVMQQVVAVLKPYGDDAPRFTRLPEKGLDRDTVLAALERLKAAEAERWKAGYVSGAVYNGDEAFSDFLARAYALNMASNPLHPDVFPSATKFEAEVVAMTAALLGADATHGTVAGTVSSGGTESILLAMKTYRDWARAEQGIAEPEIVAPTTAHAAFAKAAHYFDMRLVRVPVGADGRADVGAMAAAITPNTAVLIGSAPSFPHGVVDPIGELSELAQVRGIGCHTDACLGGFILPWAERLGYDVPLFDFRLPGVTSISADTHKYGYAPKGTSVVLYRDAELRRHQFFAITDWPGGLYFTPTFAGSRSGAVIAACWAAMAAMGEAGYTEAARRILATTAWLKAEMRQIPALEIIGDSLFLVAFRSSAFSIYQVSDQMARRGWNLNGLTQPDAVHLCVTLRHTQPGVKERFIADLKDAVAYVKAHPEASAGLGPLYGMGATVEMGDMVKELLYMLLDVLYQA
ncbi:MAG: aminotransferase class V-fold PLP-dependent enzyme [Anaerolineae bacterium]